MYHLVLCELKAYGYTFTSKTSLRVIWAICIKNQFAGYLSEYLNVGAMWWLIVRIHCLLFNDIGPTEDMLHEILVPFKYLREVQPMFPPNFIDEVSGFLGCLSNLVFFSFF